MTMIIVPNSQFTVIHNGTDLIFNYNFGEFATKELGKYKIRLFGIKINLLYNLIANFLILLLTFHFNKERFRLVSGSAINGQQLMEKILKPDPNIKAQPTEPLNVSSDYS